MDGYKLGGWIDKLTSLKITVCISYLLLCNELSQTYWLQTTNIYYLTVSVSQENTSGLAGWFWVRISHTLVVQESSHLQLD